jgi:hypothetical protein
VFVLAVAFAKHAGLPLARVLWPGRALLDDVRALVVRSIKEVTK